MDEQGALWLADSAITELQRQSTGANIHRFSNRVMVLRGRIFYVESDHKDENVKKLWEESVYTMRYCLKGQCGLCRRCYY